MVQILNQNGASTYYHANLTKFIVKDSVATTLVKYKRPFTFIMDFGERSLGKN